ncbi:ATP-binding protein [Mycobacterium sp.]|uniref:ATP-binding protein n=1 Tax=Mycobacterium sp. TaxID=1785 RepID=UPI003F9AE3CE
MRHRLADWLRTADVPDQLVADIVLVVNEACTNCVEHAYRGHGDGTLRLDARIRNGAVRARVSSTAHRPGPRSTSPFVCRPVERGTVCLPRYAGSHPRDSRIDHG